MFCNQCEETAKGFGCTVRGVCGKDAEIAGLQDVLIYTLKGLSVRNLAAMKQGGGDPGAGRCVAGGLFATLTNVNFDPARFEAAIREAARIRDALPPAGGAEPAACTWAPEGPAAIVAKAQEIIAARESVDPDLQSLRDLLIYGLKGVGAYSHHAAVLGYEDEGVMTFLQEGLAATLQPFTVDEMVGYVLACGEVGVKTLALLDTANTATYGTPEITTVSTAAGTRPGILVTGHDLKDLADLLEQTRGAGVDVYTHGEMLPAHAYPGLRQYDHLVGNYGGSWPFQREEFERFNGPVLVTTNCLVPPKDSYRDRVYTTGLVGYAGLKHIDALPDGKKDFSALIEHAKRCKAPEDLSRGDLTTGCAHAPVLAIADTVVDAVKSGAVRRFVVMAGCDGRYSGRDYYTRFAKALPADTVILTAGCAKYRYNSLGLGDIGGIPRVLDAGQCNDCYSLVVIAQALAEAFGVGINDLPISYNIAWYEQKAVLVLLSLLSLGIQDITLGPRLPAFVSPGVLKVLVENFGIRGIATVEEDLGRMVPGN
ncbi:MAG: hydroxylamine reductase [Methanomicrobiaceae archaeon]|uniref:hydroxylamine reductase n=1 Tax=Methanoculleus sp. TaxID=90427 RepID=UPI00320CF100|nr:hydroxylamine reductase [Methanomicrobiaceae archaeon]